MASLRALEGNQAVAEAIRQLQPDVVAAYPITPQTEIVQTVAQFVADGTIDAEYIAVESEHSAMSACIGAAAAGARAMTASCSQGLALMWELLYIASGMRLPIVMAVTNRTLSANLNIHCDHSDTMGARDAGWLQLYAENGQEAYDNTVQAVRIAEAVRLPVMSCLDGFITSHALEGVLVEEDEAVREFAGQRRLEPTLLDFTNPITVGPVDLPDFYFEHRRQLMSVYPQAKRMVREVGAAFGERFGRRYDLLDSYRLDDAETAVVVMGSAAGTAKETVDELREAGEAVGLIRVRCFRPFPAAEIAAALGGIKAVAVLDRATSPGASHGPLYLELTSGLFTHLGFTIPVVNYIYGLGGRDLLPEHVREAFEHLRHLREGFTAPTEPLYLGLRED